MKPSKDSLTPAFPNNKQYQDKFNKLSLCVGMQNCLLFVYSDENENDYILLAEPDLETGEEHTFFKEPQNKVQFLNESVIKIYSLTEKLSFSNFYIFILTKSRTNTDEYKIYLLNEHFDKTSIDINLEMFDHPFFKKKTKKIIDFTVSARTEATNYISIAFIIQVESNQTPYYFAFFKSLNESELEITLSNFTVNKNVISHPLFFNPLSTTASGSSSSSSEDEIPAQIQLRPPYFIFFRMKKFHITILSHQRFLTKVLNEYPLHTAYCQFIHDDSALFVFNEMISVVDFNKQSNTPVHLFQQNKMKKGTKFYLHDETLYVLIENEIYRVPIYSSQVSDISKLITVSEGKPAPYGITIACNNIIVLVDANKSGNWSETGGDLPKVTTNPSSNDTNSSNPANPVNSTNSTNSTNDTNGTNTTNETNGTSATNAVNSANATFDSNEAKGNNDVFTTKRKDCNMKTFVIAKPMNAGTFAAHRLIVSGNIFDCISSLDSQPTKELRSQAYCECFCELWRLNHEDEALTIACNYHFTVPLIELISLFEIFICRKHDVKSPLSELKKVGRPSAGDNDLAEIYNRLRFLLTQYRERYREKGESVADIDVCLVEYLIFFHRHKELTEFLESRGEKFTETTYVDQFFVSYGKDYNLYVEQALFKAGTEKYDEAMEMFKVLSQIIDPQSYSSTNRSKDKYIFSPQNEAIKILRHQKEAWQNLLKYQWIFTSDPIVGIRLFLPSDYVKSNNDVLVTQHTRSLAELKAFDSEGIEGKYWLCKFYTEWLGVSGLDSTSRLNYAKALFSELKDIQTEIIRHQSDAKGYLGANLNRLLWLDSVAHFCNTRMENENADSLPATTLEESIKEIQEIIRNTIIMMKNYPEEYESFIFDNDVKKLIDIQDIDFKKKMKWLTENYEEAIELESEGTTSESQIIAKCQHAINPAAAFKCFDKRHKDFLERKTIDENRNEKFEWEEKIEFISLYDVIASLPDTSQLSVAAPFFVSAISLLDSRTHNSEERCLIEKQVMIYQKMILAHNEIIEENEKISQERWETDL